MLASQSVYNSEVLKDYLPIFDVSQEKLAEIQADFIKQINDGLAGKESTLLMLPTYITEMPDGTEKGEYYALDLGGTNFRVLYVKLSENKGEIAEEKLAEFQVDKKVMTMHVDDLFEFLAQKVLEFLKDNGKYSADQTYTFGFCFSFPMEQTAINSAKVIQWTKGFNAEGGVGADPVELLGKALEKVGIQNCIESLLNDTVGVLAAEKYSDVDAKVGLIIGTGCNACYVEKVGNVTKWNSQGIDPKADTIIDVEWGGYYTRLLPLCLEDKQLDEESVIPGAMRFEKLLSGMYLGEIARRIIMMLTNKGQMFGGELPEAFKEFNAFTTPLLSQIDADDSEDLSSVAKLVGDFAGIEVQSISREDRNIIQQVCNMVALRSVKLVSMAISALFNQMGLSYQDSATNSRTVVAIDGGMYEKYQKYQDMLNKALPTLFGPTQCDMTQCVNLEVCEFKLNNDGSSMGAAVIAAAQRKLNENNNVGNV